MPSICDFLADARSAKDAIPVKEQEFTTLTAKNPEEEQLVLEIEALRKQCEARPSLEKEANDCIVLKENLENRKKQADEKLHKLRKHVAALIAKDLAEKELPERKAELAALEMERELYRVTHEKEKDTLNREKETLSREHASIALDENLPEKKARISTELKQITSSLEEKRRIEGESKKRSGGLEESLRQIGQAKIRLEEVNKDIAYYTTEVSEWTTLANGLGPDGIIPLEIADAGPAVTTIANELLRIYDSRYSVRLSTQEATKDNKSMKEVFDIKVLDALTNNSVSLKLMSGGQRNWIEDAVTKAICIFNKITNGRDFQTIFTDEKDGSLDMEKKKAYFQMKRKVLELGGYTQEFCITQTPDLLAMADAVINLKNGSVSFSLNN